VIDFHCHVDLYPDPVTVLNRVEAEGIYLLAITTTPLAWAGMKQIIGNRKRVKAAVGLHPELVAERHAEVTLLESLISETRYVGEVGLDGSPQHRGSFPKQDEILRRVFRECAVHRGRVISIHSRAAASGVLDALSAHSDIGVPILHWFSGSMRELERAANLGCWFSVGPSMLASAKGRRLTEAMPSDRVLTETDAPFTRNGRSGPLMPWDVANAEADLANIWRMPIEGVRDRLLGNLRQLVASTKIMNVASAEPSRASEP